MARTSAGTATRTRPAPPRRAVVAARTAAPDMPRLPATMRTRPKSPLWLSGARGDSDGTWVTTTAGAVGMARTFPGRRRRRGPARYRLRLAGRPCRAVGQAFQPDASPRQAGKPDLRGSLDRPRGAD